MPLRNFSEALREALGNGVIVAASAQDGKVALLVSASDDAVARGVSASALLQQLLSYVDGKGGGTPKLAQGGGKNPDGLGEALDAVPALISRLAMSP
jgi:alanyl-tRNA synthetase